MHAKREREKREEELVSARHVYSLKAGRIVSRYNVPREMESKAKYTTDLKK